MNVEIKGNNNQVAGGNIINNNQQTYREKKTKEILQSKIVKSATGFAKTQFGCGNLNKLTEKEFKITVEYYSKCKKNYFLEKELEQVKAELSAKKTKKMKFFGWIITRGEK